MTISKKNLFFIFSFLLALIIGIFCISFILLFRKQDNYGQNSFSYNYSEIVVSTEACNALTTSLSDCSDMISELEFNNQTLILDGDTFYYSIVEDDDSALSPKISLISDYSDLHLSAYPSSSDMDLNTSITSDIISASVPINICVYNDTYFHNYKLICTTLPMINISCSDNIKHDTSTEMSFYLFDNSAACNEREFNSDGLINTRGNTSISFDKKSFKIELTVNTPDGQRADNKSELLGLRNENEWILYSAYNDPEKIRNVFSQNLWKESCSTDNSFGIETGNEYKYVELFINNEYWGLYAICDPINTKLVNIKSDSQNDALYKIYDYVNGQHFEITENGSAYGYERKGGNTDPTPIIDYFAYLDTVKSNTAALYQGIDLDNSIDQFLFLNLIQSMDNVWKSRINNQYITILSRGGHNIALYSPWDMDISWGNEWDEIPEQNYTIPYNIPAYFNEPMEYGYLNQIMLNDDSDIWDYILGKYTSLRNTYWSDEHLDELIDTYERDIYDSGAFIRDMERWPNGNYAAPSDKLSVFRSYVHARTAESDEYIGRLYDNRHSSVYIRRSQQYKYFLESNFVIEINDPSLLARDEYRDLFDYIGIEASSISENVSYVIGNRNSGFNYISDYSMPEIPDEDTNSPSGIRILFEYNGRCNSLDLTGDYEFRP